MEEAVSIAASMSDDHKDNISQIIKSYSRRLLSFIKRRVDSTEDAEDILQDVFYQFAENTTPIEQITAWLFRTTRNKITDSYRKKNLNFWKIYFRIPGKRKIFHGMKYCFQMLQTLKANT